MISDADWKKYVDTGDVSYKVLKNIVLCIKSGESLGIRELAVYTTHADILETLLKRT
jgi:hypothetical protein